MNTCILLAFISEDQLLFSIEFLKLTRLFGEYTSMSPAREQDK